MSFTILTRVGFGMGFFRDPASRNPIPGIRDRDLLFWARSKNSEIPGIGILKPLKNPEKIPSAKSRKSRKDPEKIPKKCRVKNPKNPKIGISRGSRFFRGMGYPDKKPSLFYYCINPHAVGTDSSIPFSFLEIILQPTSYEMSPTLALRKFLKIRFSKTYNMF